MIDSNMIMVFGGMILLAIFAICATVVYESNVDEVEPISPWVGIPLCMVFFYLYMDNFSFTVYMLSIGAIVMLFI